MGNDSFEILIKNQIDEIQRVYARFEEFVGNAKLQKNITGKINMVFDELLSNIIQYGYQDSDEHEIKIMVNVIGSKMQIQIEDDGIAFNPFEAGAPDTNKPLDDRDIGGLGIHLTQSVMDECQYQRMGNENIVTLVKRLDE
jgi:anti-sigma regulatory factor (Ser/Thr protein kinase)